MRSLLLTFALVLSATLSLFAQNLTWINDVGYSTTAVKFDPAGNIIVQGQLGGTTDIDPGPGNYTLNIGDGHHVVAKYDPSGNLLWGFNVVSDIGTPCDMDVDENGDILMMGWAQSDTLDMDPGPAVAQLAPGTSYHILYFAKYDSNGNYLWHKWVATNTSYHSGMGGITHDADNNWYLTGAFINYNNSLTPFPDNNLWSGTFGAWAAKLDPNGNYEWVRPMHEGNTGVFGLNGGWDVTLDDEKSLYIGGRFVGSINVDGTSFSGSPNNDFDAFIVKLDSTGSLAWGQTFGVDNPGNDYENVYGLEVINDNLFVVGESKQDSVDIDPGPAVNKVYGGYIARFDAATGSYEDSQSGDGYALYDLEAGDDQRLYCTGTIYGPTTIDVDDNPAVGLASVSGYGLVLVRYDTAFNASMLQALRLYGFTFTDVDHRLALNQDVLLLTGNGTIVADFDFSASGTSILQSGYGYLGYYDTTAISCDTTIAALVVLCTGDSVYLGGQWRSTPGVYNDTSYSGACATISATTLSYSNGPGIDAGTDTTVCSGTSFSLGATMNGVLLSEDFASGLPSDWYTIDHSGNGGNWAHTTTAPVNWVTYGLPGTQPAFSGPVGYMMFDSDGLGSSVGGEDASLGLPRLDCSALTTVVLDFEQQFCHYVLDQTIIQVSTDSTNWTDIVGNTGMNQNDCTSNPEEISVNISYIAAGQPNVWIRFRWMGDWDYWWNIDNVIVHDGTTYAWSPAATLSDSTAANPMATPLVNTQYTLVATDAYGCIAYDTVQVNLTSFTAVAGPDTTICPGDSVQIYSTGASSYVWDQGLGTDSSYSVAPTTNTTYTVTATDSYGCTATASATISMNVAAATIGGVGAQYCLDTSSYTLSGTPSGGTFSGPGVSGSDWNIGTAGVGTHTLRYDVVSGGCPLADSLTVTVDTIPVVSFSGLAGSYCPTATSNPLVGSPAGGTFSGPGMSGTDFISQAAGLGTHDIIYSFTDGNSCAASDTQTVVVQGVSASITGLSATHCAFGQPDTMQGIPTGGMFSGTGVSGDVFDPGVAPVGLHDIVYTYTDTATGCTTYDTLTVEVFALPTPDLGNDTAICSGNSLTLDAGSASAYNWSNGLPANQTNAVTPPIATTYYVTVTDANGCNGIDSIAVALTALPAVSFSGLDSAYCPTGAADTLAGLPAGGSFSGSAISGNVFDPAGQPTGTVVVTYSYTDTNGCSASVMDSALVLSLPMVVAAPDTSICLGDSVAISASGAVSYSWDNGLGAGAFQVVSPSATQSYNVTGTDANGCLNSDFVTVTITTPPNVNIIVFDSTHCANDAAVGVTGVPLGGTLSGNGIVAGSFDPATAGAGVHPVLYQYTDTNGCTSSTTMNMTVYAMPLADAGSDTVLCLGDSITLAASGGNTYSWDNGLGAGASHTVMPADTTTYSVTVTGANACSATAQVEVAINPGPDLQLYQDIIPCPYETTQLLAIGGDTYMWSGNLGPDEEQYISPAADITYYVTATDAMGCTTVDSIEVQVLTPPTIYAGEDTTICEGQSVLLTATGGNIYDWDGMGSGATLLVSPTVSTTYYVYATDFNGCEGEDLVTVNVTPAPDINIFGLDSNYCVADPPSNLIGDPVGGTLVGPGISGSQFDPAAAGAGTHTIVYSYTDPFNCTYNEQVPVVVELCDGIDELLAGNIKLFPNPTRDQFTISVEPGMRLNSVRITDLSGRLIETIRLSAGGNQCTVSSLAAGTYLVHLDVDGHRVVFRQVVQ